MDCQRRWPWKLLCDSVSFSRRHTSLYERLCCHPINFRSHGNGDDLWCGNGIYYFRGSVLNTGGACCICFGKKTHVCDVHNLRIDRFNAGGIHFSNERRHFAVTLIPIFIQNGKDIFRNSFTLSISSCALLYFIVSLCSITPIICHAIIQCAPHCM